MENKKDNLKNALCYIPLVNIVLFFVEENKTEEFKKHLNKGLLLFFIYLFIKAILWMFFWYWWWYWWVITLIYFIISGVLFYKAYNWENIQIEVLDNVEEKIKDTFK